MQWIRACYWMLIRFLTRFRYRVRVEGLEKLRNLRGPTLVMPNHVGLIDPPLVLSNIHIPGGLRPIVTTSMYRRPLLYPLMRLVNAIEVPELVGHSREARDQTLTMIDTVAAGLNRGDNFLIYPAGRIERRGIEEIGATRAVAELLRRCPQANIVLVRTRGLWGSIFSMAYTGDHPDLERCVLRAVGWVFAALFVFLPRRNVTMTVEQIDRRDLPGITRDKLNPFLEEWYNRGAPEKPTFVPFSFLFGPRQHDFPVLIKTGQDLAKIQPATIRAVNEMVEERLKRPLSAEENSADVLLERLGLDSLERMDLALHIEERFGFRSDRVADSLGELWALAEGQLTTGAAKAESAPPAWDVPPSDTEDLIVLGETLAEAFVRRVLKDPDDVAAADRLSGVLSYRKLYVGARLMAKRFKQLESVPLALRERDGERGIPRGMENAGSPPRGKPSAPAPLPEGEGSLHPVGVLLPGSVAADVVFFGLHLAGKLPVLLNWTTGPGNLAHAVKTLGVRHVVTSKKLIDRLGIQIEGAEYLFLEDVRAGIGKLEAAMTLLSTYVLPSRLLHGVPRPGDHGNMVPAGAPSPDAPAVVLFTSGSESAPKAVPLSHRNLITNLQASLAVLQASRGDVLLGFLPPFHSFGLLANVLAPVLAGIRVAHYPDPTDAAGLVRTVAAYKTTIMVTTPTFLGYMFAAAKPEELASLRIIVTGAEKCPEALFERAKQMVPRAFIMEGYGITECSPVVAGNLPGKLKPGSVGPPVAGVEVCLVDPDTHRRLPTLATGMLLVRGPSIFNGYWNYHGPEPFTEVDGKRWYITGDLVRLDEDGYIYFCGRLKRFLKIGGEMVSLPALEEPLSVRYPPTDKGPQVAVEGVDAPSRWIVLFTTLDISLKQANAILAEAGLRGVMRLDAVERIEAIPVLGTGKTDYKVLRKLVAERAVKV